MSEHGSLPSRTESIPNTRGRRDSDWSDEEDDTDSERIVVNTDDFLREAATHPTFDQNYSNRLESNEETTSQNTSEEQQPSRENTILPPPPVPNEENDGEGEDEVGTRSNIASGGEGSSFSNQEPDEGSISSSSSEDYYSPSSQTEDESSNESTPVNGGSRQGSSVERRRDDFEEESGARGVTKGQWHSPNRTILPDANLPIFQHPEGMRIRSKISPQLLNKLLNISQNRNNSVALFFAQEDLPINNLALANPTNSDERRLENWNWDDDSFVPVPLYAQCCPWEELVTNLLMLQSYCETSESLQRNPAQIGNLFEQTLSKYHPNADTLSNFEILNHSDISQFIVSSLPTIIQFAVQLPYLLSRPVPLLFKGQPQTIFLTKKLCCALIANAFLCTFPERREDALLPEINFFSLFHWTDEEMASVKVEKLMCFLNYFHQMNAVMEYQKDDSTEKVEDYILSFERKCRKEKVKWSRSSKKLSKVEVDLERKIEEKFGLLQVDFANKLIGGGVLNDGSVMEEIRFCICPELLVSRLFTQELGDDEVLVVKGSQQFSCYDGYSDRFQYRGPLNQFNIPRDDLGRMATEIVAMDAIHFKRNESGDGSQYRENLMERELHKAVTAFHDEGNARVPVATGNWGCGAFNGDPELKFLIQWMAASECGRELHFHTVGDEVQREDVKEIVRFLEENYVNVGMLYKIVVKFYGEHFHCDSVFEFVKFCVRNNYGRR